MNKTMITIIKKYVADYQRNWDEYIPMAELEYNCSEHTTTKETPYFLVFVQEPRTPMEMFYKINPTERGRTEKVWREDVILRLYHGMKGISEKINEQHKKNALRFLQRVKT